ncbi:MAG TPA: hypothetical protein VLJ16_07050 [Acidobacteriota bacterium]|nr:hypothetical protein [Acidobacteriota bacterium]
MTGLSRAPEIERSLDLVERWIEAHDYRGYEPFDGLTSYLFPLTLKSRVACQVLQQAVRRSPVNLRPLLGIKPLDSTKGRGYVAWGYLKRHQLDGAETYRDKALEGLDWLDKNKSPLYPDHSWGNHFHYASRSGYIFRQESTIVWTGLIGQVFLEAYALFGLPRHLEIIRSIADWMMKLPREETKNGLCLSYIMRHQSSIHNSNMIGAAFLAGAAVVAREPGYQALARRAMEYSCAGQLKDGAWYYGEDPKYHWVDVFHTGYNLDALKKYQFYSGDASFRGSLERGYEYFRRHFFESGGRVRYYHDRARPIDIQCASQAIDTLLLFSSEDPEAAAVAERAALWSIRHMQDRDGHFYFRYYAPGLHNRAAMIHWGQATMHKSLACLLLGGRQKNIGPSPSKEV